MGKRRRYRRKSSGRRLLYFLVAVLLLAGSVLWAHGLPYNYTVDPRYPLEIACPYPDGDFRGLSENIQTRSNLSRLGKKVTELQRAWIASGHKPFKVGQGLRPQGYQFHLNKVANYYRMKTGRQAFATKCDMDDSTNISVPPWDSLTLASQRHWDHEMQVHGFFNKIPLACDSNHSRGLAVDLIARGNQSALQALARRNGFKTISNDPIHFEISE